MNFLELISKIVSITSTFILFLIVLVIIKFYIYDFLKIFSNYGKLFLKVKDSKDEDLIFKDKILIDKSLSIGNEITNDIVLNCKCDYLVKLVIFKHDDKIYAESFSNEEYVKIGNNSILGRVELKGNEEICVLHTLFQLIKK